MTATETASLSCAINGCEFAELDLRLGGKTTQDHIAAPDIIQGLCSTARKLVSNELGLEMSCGIAALDHLQVLSNDDDERASEVVVRIHEMFDQSQEIFEDEEPQNA